MVNFKNNKGITLYALIITVVVLVLIAGTATYTGMDVYQDAKEEAFIQELQILQNWVNNENSKIELSSLKDEENDGRFDYIYNLTWENGQNLEDYDLPNEITNLIGEGNGYRCFEKADLEEIGVYGVNQPVIINFTTRDVIAVNGLNGKYKMSDFDETTNYNSNVVIKIDNVPIPNGFVYLAGSKEEGLVIKNIKDGNEFVWVPVENIDNFAELQEDSNDNYRGILYATSVGNNYNINTDPKNTSYDANNGLREPAIITGNDSGTGDSYDGNTTIINAIKETKYTTLLEQFQNEFNSMVESVKKYKGFYVGRYETAWNNVDKKVISLSGQNPMTCYTSLYNEWVKFDNSNDNNNRATWYGLYQKQKELYDEENLSVESGMIYGTQWDAIMNWMNKDTEIDIKNSINKGVYKPNYTAKQQTGCYEIKNIFDMAGNYSEMTQEASGNAYRIARGGLYNTEGNNQPISFREIRNSDNSGLSAVSSRLQLYIKLD